MNEIFNKNIIYYKKQLNEPLFKNSFFLMISTLTSSLSGFFFWILAAKFYPTDEVGLAAAIISPMALIGILSLMGFDISLIKYISEFKEKNDLISTCFSTVFLVSLLLVIIFITGLDFWSPSFSVLKDNLYLLVLFTILTLLNPLQLLQSQGVFVGFRKTKYSFYQGLITLFRIAIVPLLVNYGAMGIFVPYGITLALSFIAGIFYLRKITPYVFSFKIDTVILKKIFHFSVESYLARIFEILPTFILPILVINKLGAVANAYFYIAWQISMLILIFSKSISNSLFAEIITNKETTKDLIVKATKFTSVLLLSFIASIFLFGKYLLMLYGSDYVDNSFSFLCILAVASIPFSFNTIYIGIKRSEGDSLTSIIVYGITSTFCLVGSYVLIESFELMGIAYSWIAANLICSILLIVHLMIQKLFTRRFKNDSLRINY